MQFGTPNRFPQYPKPASWGAAVPWPPPFDVWVIVRRVVGAKPLTAAEKQTLAKSLSTLGECEAEIQASSPEGARAELRKQSRMLAEGHADGSPNAIRLAGTALASAEATEGALRDALAPRMAAAHEAVSPIATRVLGLVEAEFDRATGKFITAMAEIGAELEEQDQTEFFEARVENSRGFFENARAEIGRGNGLYQLRSWGIPEAGA